MLTRCSAAAGANLGFSVNMAHSGSNCGIGSPSLDGSLAGEASIYCKATDNSTFALCMDTTSWNPTPGDLYGYAGMGGCAVVLRENC